MIKCFVFLQTDTINVFCKSKAFLNRVKPKQPQLSIRFFLSLWVGAWQAIIILRQYQLHFRGVSCHLYGFVLPPLSVWGKAIALFITNAKQERKKQANAYDESVRFVRI